MIQATRKHHVKLMTAYRLHFEPATLAAIELVKSGQLGEGRYFNSSFSYNIAGENIRLQFARGGGPLYDLGTYCINAARGLMRDEPDEVTGMLTRSADERFREVEETAAAILRFPRGRLATFAISFGSAETSRLEFVGTKGRLVMEPAYDYSKSLQQIVTIGDHVERKTFARTDQFGGEIEAFSACILENREPEPSGVEGLADVRIIEAIFSSDARGRAVRFAPFKKPVRPTGRQVKRKPPVKKPPAIDAEAPHD
ncbi:MAG: Gfo/Idh/MocA family oxidoreductase [Lacunisphaera sp.]